MKSNLLVYGNCQGSWLAHALKLDGETSLQYDVHYFPNYGDPESHDRALQSEYWRDDTLLIRQVAPDSPTPPFEQFLSRGITQLRFPTVWGKFLWPFNVPDPRNKPEEGLPFGPYFYGDRLVVQWLNEGLTPSEIRERYLTTDLSSLINLKRYIEMCFAEMKFTDKQSDITVFPFIEKNYSKHKLFGSINHPSMLLLDYIFQHVKSWIHYRSTPRSINSPHDAMDILGEEEIPIHPQLMEHLKLEWAWPEMKFHFRSKMLTFAEYIEAYSRFDSIPPGMPVSLWMERADQAYGMGKKEEARRLLHLGLQHHGQDPSLFQSLCVLLTEMGDFGSAYQFLNQALGLPALSPELKAQFKNNLGIVYYHQGQFSEAITSFEEALQFWPNWQEAADNLNDVRQVVHN